MRRIAIFGEDGHPDRRMYRGHDGGAPVAPPVVAPRLAWMDADAVVRAHARCSNRRERLADPPRPCCSDDRRTVAHDERRVCYGTTEVPDIDLDRG
jgi:hypothetical protein